MRLLRGALVERDPALELALARAMVTEARLGQVEESLRIYQPASPVVVFGRRDTRLPGFPRAVEAARAAGFAPTVRATGGRAVAYTSAALVVDHVRHEPGPTGGQDARFAEFGKRFVDLFRGYGIDARLGAVPGEYCPGAHSVNARGVEKLVGTAQRMVPGAWLFSSLVVVGDEDRLRPVLTEVYRCLGQDFDEGSVGSLSREAPGLDIDSVEAAVVDAYRAGGPAIPAVVDDDLLDMARSLAPQHRVEARRPELRLEGTVVANGPLDGQDDPSAAAGQ
jgi:octanoyl-[GcvH]:protein N-octanoyltransferase